MKQLVLLYDAWGKPEKAVRMEADSAIPRRQPKAELILALSSKFGHLAELFKKFNQSPV